MESGNLGEPLPNKSCFLNASHSVPFALVGADGASDLVGLSPDHGRVVANHALGGLSTGEGADASGSSQKVGDLETDS